ncbi:class I SAM-dependent methyltransferase [Denitratisoma sp. agr-D3]
MDSIRLLIFPLDLDETTPVIRVAASLRIPTVGASSALSSAEGRAVDHFIKLPFVTEPSFNDALAEALGRFGITTVFAPHQGVWRHLNTLLCTQPDRYSFSLCKPDPFTATWQLFAPHEDWARNVLDAPWRPEEPIRPPLSHSSYAALHRLFLSTPGQSDEGKLHALCDIAQLLPRGDMLEVGCLYGRSAIALGFLAARYQIGNLICVDPWRTAAVTDQGTQASILNADLKTINLEQIFRIFLATAAQLNNIGYIRETSTEAHPIYESARRDGVLHSAELGSITLSPHLSLLHIDGNHRYDHVKQDIATWTPHLISGGWLLLDDYVWAFGDGPRRAGDELLSSPLWDTAVVSGDTLFLRRSSISSTIA